MARVPGGFGIDDVMGVSRPDRSVSLRDVNELSVETAGLADAGWSASVAKPGAWSSDAESWKELLTAHPYNTVSVQAGKFDVTLQIDDVIERPGRGDALVGGPIAHEVVRRWQSAVETAGLAEGLNLSPEGDVYMDFEVHPEANASEMTAGEVRESLRLVGEIAESLQDEGLNVMASPMSPQHERLYRQFGMVPLYEEVGELTTGMEPLVLPGRHDSYEWSEDRFHNLSQGLSDEDRRLMEQPQGFMPSPPLPELPGFMPSPPLPELPGFQPSLPISGLLPGAPIRGPQLPTVLSMEGQQALPGMLTPEEDAKERERQRNLEAVEESRRRLEHGNPPEPPNHLDHLAQQQAIRDALFAIAAGGGAAALGGFGGGGMLRGMGSGLGAFR